MNEDASATNQNGNTTSGTPPNSSTPTGRDDNTSPAYRETIKLRKEMSAPQLTGKYLYIKPIAETQRDRLSTDMAKSCKAMLTIIEDINLKSENSRELRDATYATTEAGVTGLGHAPPFIPKNIREITMPLNHSKLVKKDSRCNSSFSEITTTLGRAHQIHEAFKAEMAKLAQSVAKEELCARRDLLFCEYAVTVENIAEGLTITGKYKLGHKLKLSEKDIAHAAIHHATNGGFDDAHWEQLPFVSSSSGEEIEKYHKKFEQFTGITFETSIATKLRQGVINMSEDDYYEDADDERDYGTHHDWPLIKWIAGELCNIIPTITTKFWAHEKQKDIERKMDAELDLLYSKKEIDKANDDLASAMQVDEGEAMDSHIKKTVDKELDRRIANRKKEARKNSSGGPNDQGSTAQENGHKKGKRSKGKGKKQGQPSRKRYNDSTNDDSPDDSGNNNNRRSRSRHRKDDKDSTRGRSKNPKGILRNKDRSVSFGRSTTPDPPRSRYSDEKSVRQSRGTTRQHGERQNNRGGRGGSRRGRGGKHGKRS